MRSQLHPPLSSCPAISPGFLAIAHVRALPLGTTPVIPVLHLRPPRHGHWRALWPLHPPNPHSKFSPLNSGGNRSLPVEEDAISKALQNGGYQNKQALRISSSAHVYKGGIILPNKGLTS